MMRGIINVKNFLFFFIILCSLDAARSQGHVDNCEFIDIFPGIKVAIAENEIFVKFDGKSTFGDNAVRGRHDHDDNNQPSEKKPNILQRIGGMMMMIPFVMQLLSLPGALASIKLSLLKSLIVGKMALIVMLFNILRSSRSSEVVVVHQPPPVHYDHYYSPYEEEEDKGWFG